MKPQPTITLEEQAAERIENEFPDNLSGIVRVVWWDSGGFLRNIVESAASSLDIGFRAAERFPLELRMGAVGEEHGGDNQMVWYIPEAKADRDWFRDIREVGGEITSSIEELTAELYDVNAWDIFDAERHSPEARATAAEIILDRFASPGIPQYEILKEEIMTKGDGQILDHLLRTGWPEIDESEETIDDVRSRLQSNHGIPVADNAGPTEITDTVRRWAVARWLIESIGDANHFPAEYEAKGHNPLKSILEYRGSIESGNQYMGPAFWPEVIDDVDDVWAIADCPVDGALDAALWTSWVNAFQSGEVEYCIDKAHDRQSHLSIYPENSAWRRLWEQAEHLGYLRKYFTEWEERDEQVDPFDAYTDATDGSWRIDGEVLDLQLTGTPDAELPASHPATDSLAPIRNELLTHRYREYLETLANDVRAAMQISQGSPLHDKPSAYKWWRDHKEDFDKSGSVAILLIDALRFDLAQQLADELSDNFEVKRETRVSTLPSETKFGMAALTPGRAFRFKLKMDGETLVPEQGERTLKTKQDRVDFLDSEGWSVPSSRDSGWEHHRIAYYDKEIDDVGEGEIGDIESHFRGYIEDLVETISRKLTHENWDRIYVVTDHGFVLLPEDTEMESVSVSYTNSEVKYRRVAGDSVEHAGTGVHLDANTPGIDYLHTDLQLLVDPRQHYSKQGYSDSRYYHGGILPQECMLSFLEIER